MRIATIAAVTLAAGLAVGCSNDKSAGVDTSSPRGGGNALDVSTPDRNANSSASTGQPGGMAGGVGAEPVVGSAGNIGAKNAQPTPELTPGTPTTSPAGETP